MSEPDTLLAFPCQFPVKAMGLRSANFDMIVVEIIRRHAGAVPEGSVTSRPSKAGKYISVTVLVEATSKAQLDAIYQDLSDHPDVLMTL